MGQWGSCSTLKRNGIFIYLIFRKRTIPSILKTVSDNSDRWFHLNRLNQNLQNKQIIDNKIFRTWPLLGPLSSVKFGDSMLFDSNLIWTNLIADLNLTFSVSNQSWSKFNQIWTNRLENWDNNSSNNLVKISIFNYELDFFLIMNLIILSDSKYKMPKLSNHAIN